jgi:hypothetical protein
VAHPPPAADEHAKAEEEEGGRETGIHKHEETMEAIERSLI